MVRLGIVAAQHTSRLTRKSPIRLVSHQLTVLTYPGYGITLAIASLTTSSLLITAMAGKVGFEPTTTALTARRSTIELLATR